MKGQVSLSVQPPTQSSVKSIARLPVYAAGSHPRNLKQPNEAQ
jgi:hypothetical protein